MHRALAARCAHACGASHARGHVDAKTGSVTFVQSYGGGLHLNLHLHMLGLDGWFHRREDTQVVFEAAPAPTQSDVEELGLDVQARVMRLLEREGLLDVDGTDPLVGQSRTLAACYEGAVTSRVGLGPARGRPVMKLGVPPGEMAPHTSGFEPLELMERLAAPIPKPRVTLVLYAGVLVQTPSSESMASPTSAPPCCTPHRQPRPRPVRCGKPGRP